MTLIATRLQAVKPSPTLAITTKARELKANGIDIISLAAGEPDFDTPDNIKEAAIQGINNDETKYTAVSGTIELKNAVCSKFKRDNQLTYNQDEIIVSTGGKQVIFNLFMATINHGDEVIIPAPYWVSYPDMVLLAGGKPVIILSNMNNGFAPTIADIEHAINNNTKWFILNSPSNPTGATYSAEDLQEFAKLFRKYPHVNIMCDDIYEHIIFDNFQFKTLATLAPDLKDRIFIVNGVSKAYSMTGWRIGYGAGNKKIIKAMSVIQSQSTSNPSSVSQVAAVEALNGPQNFLIDNCKLFCKKRNLVLSALKTINGLECYKSNGAFYLFPECSKLFGKKTDNGDIIKNSTDFATYLLESANVAVVPGIAFGIEGYFRISYATSESILAKACDRIAKSVTRLI